MRCARAAAALWFAGTACAPLCSRALRLAPHPSPNIRNGAHTTAEHAVPAGTVVIREGEKGNHFYVVDQVSLASRPAPHGLRARKAACAQSVLSLRARRLRLLRSVAWHSRARRPPPTRPLSPCALSAAAPRCARAVPPSAGRVRRFQLGSNGQRWARQELPPRRLVRRARAHVRRCRRCRLVGKCARICARRLGSARRRVPLLRAAAVPTAAAAAAVASRLRAAALRMPLCACSAAAQPMGNAAPSCPVLPLTRHNPPPPSAERLRSLLRLLLPLRAGTTVRALPRSLRALTVSSGRSTAPPSGACCSRRTRAKPSCTSSSSRRHALPPARRAPLPPCDACRGITFEAGDCVSSRLSLLSPLVTSVARVSRYKGGACSWRHVRGTHATRRPSQAALVYAAAH